MRILQVVDSMDLGGIQSFLMNIYRNLNKNKIQFDFLVFRNTDQYFEKEILSLGGKIYKLPGRRDGFIKSKKALNQFFCQHKEYNIVHYHTSSISYIDPIQIAHKCGVKNIIVHAHSTRAPGSKIQTVLHYLNKPKIYKYANNYIACGKAAATWMYGNTKCEKNVKVIYNGISLNKFKFNDDLRKLKRKELGIENKYVVGHVGRFSRVKNHSFIIDVFSSILKVKKDSVLLLVGTGEMMENVKNKVLELNLQNSVIFAGTRSDVNDLLNAMDIMVFPSLYEGFPVTLIEAQASGLPCIISDTISDEVIINDNVKQISLNSSIDDWANLALSIHRQMTLGNFEDSVFSISNTIKQMSNIYEL